MQLAHWARIKLTALRTDLAWSAAVEIESQRSRRFSPSDGGSAYGVVNVFIELMTPSLVPSGPIESTR